MKKLMTLLLSLILALTCFALVACGDDDGNGGKPDYGTLTIENITIAEGESKLVVPTFSKEEFKSDVTYTFDGEGISFVNGRVKGLAVGTTTVTATTTYHTATFTVTVTADYGKIKITSPKAVWLNYSGQPIVATFTNPNHAGEITYTLTNEAQLSGITVKIENGVISATGSTPVAKTAKIKATTAIESQTCEFNVKIDHYNGTSSSGGSLNFENRINEFRNANQTYSGVQGGEKGGTLFVGDSFFDNAFWTNFYATYAGKNAYRYGVSASTLEDWLVVSEKIVYPYEPKNIVLHCGTNDIHDDGRSATKTAEMMEELLTEYHEELPYAKIFVFSIEPRRVDGNSNQPRNTWSKCKDANALIKAFCDENSTWLTYIDSAKWCFTDDSETTINTSFYKSGDATHIAVSSYNNYVNALNSAGLVVENTGCGGSGKEEPVNYGELSIQNIVMNATDNVSATPVFSIPEKAEDIEYEIITGNGVTINNEGKITVVNANSVTHFKATTAHHEANFSVTVNPVITDVEVPSVIYLNLAKKEYSFSVANGFNASDVTVTASGLSNYQNATLTVEDGKIFAVGSLGTAQNGVEYLEATATVTIEHQYQTVQKTVKVRQYDGKSSSGSSLNLNTTGANRYDNASELLGENGTLFVGDSFFDTGGFWKNFYSESYFRKNAVSVGISATTVSDWLMISDRLVYPFNPANIVLHLSTNDLHDDALTAEQTETLFKQLLSEYHSKLPNAKIYFFSVEPRRVDGNSSQPRSTWAKCKAFNALMKTYAESNSTWLTYIDSASWCFTDNSETTIKTSFYKEGDATHVAVASYATYVNALNTAGLTVGASTVASNTTISEFTTTLSNTAGTGKRLSYRGLELTTEYVLTGKLDISDIGANGHYQFRFNGANNRFLLWDSNSDKTVGVGYSYSGEYVNETTAPTTYTFTAGNTLTILWKIIVTNKNAYFYTGVANGNATSYTLEVVFYNVPVREGMYIGSEKMATKAYDMVAKTKLDDETEYNALITAANLSAYENLAVFYEFR